jgi:hypothetical protein
MLLQWASLGRPSPFSSPTAARLLAGSEPAFPLPAPQPARWSTGKRTTPGATDAVVETVFDELARLNLGNIEAYRHAREMAFRWLLRVPLANDAWSAYFEDVDIHSDVTAKQRCPIGRPGSKITC